MAYSAFDMGGAFVANEKESSLRSDAAAPSGLLGRISFALQVARERRALGKLSSEQLSDLGVSEEEARREAARPFWDLPAWRKD